MATRGRVYEDQFELLSRGWSLAQEGRWVPYGNPSSTGGYVPGGLTSLVVGLPLFLWQDYRAPSFLIVFLHIVAYWILDRMLGEILTIRERFLFCVLYWLNPWRMYFSAFLWNPNYLFLFGALHTYTCFRQRYQANFWHSFLHVLAIGCAFQLHGSFIILVLASLLLYARGYFRPHWIGLLCGGVLILISLVPWLIHARAHPEILPIGHGFLGRGLVSVYPVLKGVGYWLRYSSLSFSQSMIGFEFTHSPAEDIAFMLVPTLFVLTQVVGPVSVILPLLANVRLFRVHLRSLRKASTGGSQRLWLGGYIVWTFVAAFLAFCLAPTPVMMWHGFLIMHVAVLPLVIWLGALLRTRQSQLIIRGLQVCVPVLVFILLCLSLGSKMYRGAGTSELSADVDHSHPLVRGLGIRQ